MKHWLVVCSVSCLLWTCCASQGGCEEPPDIDFGEIVSDEKVGYQEHDRIQYRCNPGFALEGSEWISCNGQRWTPPPKCLASCSITRQQLDTKNLLLSSGRRRSQLVRSNQTLEFKCREGYVITTPSVRKCVDGRMDLPSCISERGKNCSRSPTIENGDIITLSQKEYASGSWVEFKCQQYYAMEGESRSFCNNGTWTKVPACLEPCVIALSESQQIVVKGSSYDSGFQTMYLQRGDSVELSCKPGYVLEANPSQSTFLIQCNEEPIVYPKCKEITCNPPQVTNGTFRPRRKMYQGGDLIQIECNREVQLENGQNVAECTSSGWSPSPQCGGDTTCQELPAIANAVVLSGEEAPYKPGHHVQYQCHEGFTMSGSDTIICEKKRWSKLPVCQDATCPPPPSVSHGQLIGQPKERYLPFEKVRYRCDQGWSLFGPQSVTCSNKQWTELPTCTNAGGMCGRPPVIENGDIRETAVAQYKPNSIVNYQCVSFYIMRGSPAVQCIFGHWTQAPTCIAACTATEEAMLSHKIQLKWFPAEKLYSQSGDEMEFVCRPGFHPAPSSPPFRVRCVEGHIEYPTCIKFCTTNEQTMRNRNIQLTQISETGSKIPSGDVVVFTCRRGYREAPNSPPFRVQCNEGNLEYPRCTRTYG